MQTHARQETGFTAAQRTVLRDTGTLMSHAAALHNLRGETALARIASTSADAITGATRAAAIMQAPRQTGCTLNCSQGHRCTCTGASMPRMAPRPARRTPNLIEQRASDFGALDLLHKEHDATAGEVAEQMTRRDAIMARVYRWGWRIALVTAAGIWMTGCGGGGSIDDDTGERFVPALVTTAIPLSNEQQQQLPLVEVFGDSTMVRIYADQAGDAVAYAENDIGQRLQNSAVAGSTALSVSPRRVASSTAKAVALNWAINDSADVPEDAYRARITAQAEDAIAAGKSVILIESTPIVPGGPLSHHRSETKRQAYEVIKRDVAQRTGAYYCAMPARTWTLEDKPDGIHEGEAAARWKGLVLADCIRRAI